VKSTPCSAFYAGEALGETANLQQRVGSNSHATSFGGQKRFINEYALAETKVLSPAQVELYSSACPGPSAVTNIFDRLRLLEDTFLSLDRLGQCLLRRYRLNGIEELRTD